MVLVSGVYGPVDFDGALQHLRTMKIHYDAIVEGILCCNAIMFLALPLRV